MRIEERGNRDDSRRTECSRARARGTQGEHGRSRRPRQDGGQLATTNAWAVVRLTDGVHHGWNTLSNQLVSLERCGAPPTNVATIVSTRNCTAALVDRARSQRSRVRLNFFRAYSHGHSWISLVSSGNLLEQRSTQVHNASTLVCDDELATNNKLLRRAGWLVDGSYINLCKSPVFVK